MICICLSFLSLLFSFIRPLYVCVYPKGYCRFILCFCIARASYYGICRMLTSLFYCFSVDDRYYFIRCNSSDISYSIASPFCVHLYFASSMFGVRILFHVYPYFSLKLLVPCSSINLLLSRFRVLYFDSTDSYLTPYLTKENTFCSP